LAGDIRLVQLARILGKPVVTPEGARAAFADAPATITAAFLEEAAANDDVVSIEAARSYLEDRLAYFGDLVPQAAGSAIRSAFAAAVSRWE
jgi:hypothetical protein